MATNGVNRSEGGIHIPDHNMPSDYNDVQPSSYDPDFITDISSKMQVPHRISVAADYINKDMGMQESTSSYVGMSVPDKIVLAGDNQHIGMRHDLNLDLDHHAPHASESLSYVGLITPPRTLTLDERFPIVEDNDDKKRPRGGSPDGMVKPVVTNGHIGVPVPYDPGVNLQDSVLLNEEDEATLLRTQVAKLTRRVQVIEHENQSRFQRDMVMYPLILGYFFWKILGWFTRDR